tara:strand:+ start:527 stop:706 length:180 start_codon:yes stop_codon:yes gene_type:complete
MEQGQRNRRISHHQNLDEYVHFFHQQSIASSKRSHPPDERWGWKGSHLASGGALDLHGA